MKLKNAVPNYMGDRKADGQDDDEPIAVFDTNAKTMIVYNNPPRIWWTDGPREGEDDFPTMRDALMEFADSIINYAEDSNAEDDFGTVPHSSTIPHPSS